MSCVSETARNRSSHATLGVYIYVYALFTMTRMVRASDDTLERLRRLRELSGESTAELLERAVELLERDRFLDAANEAFGELRGDPEAWRAESAERGLWEGTLGDGATERS